jgi:hypothetical protein
VKFHRSNLRYFRSSVGCVDLSVIYNTSHECVVVKEYVNYVSIPEYGLD